jgi:hypothetical protein
MRNQHLALPMAIAGVLIVGALAVSLALLSPDKLGKALIGGLTLPVLWGAIEFWKGDKSHARFAVVVAAGLIAVPLGVKVARAAGFIGADEGALILTLFGIAGGLVFAAYGNVIPKKLGRYDPAVDPARRQAFQRQAGWTFVLAGLACAAIWATMPVKQAAFWSTVPVGGAVILVLALVIACHLRWRKA